MEILVNNSNLAIDIGHKITKLLDTESVQACRLVNSSMKNMVDNPRFWLQKLEKKGLAKEHLIKWRKLVDLVENTDLIENATKCLMRMHQHFSKWAQGPIHIASKAGDANLLQIILEKVDKKMEPNVFGTMPMTLAAQGGFLEVVKVITKFTDNSNAPDNDGWTPIHSAAKNGHIEVVKMLMTTTHNPNPSTNLGITPQGLALQYNHHDIAALFVQN